MDHHLPLGFKVQLVKIRFKMGTSTTFKSASKVVVFIKRDNGAQHFSTAAKLSLFVVLFDFFKHF